MNAVVRLEQKSVLVRMSERFGIDADKMLSTLKATAFRGDASNEQLMALCVVAEQYGLNPWTKEIYAFPAQRGEIVPIVGVDGWLRIINSNPNFDGMDFKEAETPDGGVPAWIECSIHRKDRSHPTTAREYYAEVKRDSAAPWRSHPRRMLRHKAVIQCARMAFGFAGIYDPDEGEAVTAAIDARGQEEDRVASYVKRYQDALDVDLSEEACAQGIAAIERETWGDADLQIAVGAKLGSKDRNAVKKYLEIAKRLQDAEFTDAQAPSGKID